MFFTLKHFAKVPKEEGVKIFVVVVGDNCKTPAETFCPGDRKVLADRLATNHILLQTIPADENYISTNTTKYKYKNISYQGNNFLSSRLTSDK